MERLLRVEVVADQLGVQPVTVWKMIREHRITSTKIGRARRIPATEIDRLIRAGLSPAEVKEGDDA